MITRYIKLSVDKEPHDEVLCISYISRLMFLILLHLTITFAPSHELLSSWNNVKHKPAWATVGLYTEI